MSNQTRKKREQQRQKIHTAYRNTYIILYYKKITQQNDIKI